MKKKIWLILLFLEMGNSHAVQLVCKGEQLLLDNQRPIFIDCFSRKAVINALFAGWLFLVNENVGEGMEKLCLEPYKRAQAIHPSVPFKAGLVETYFMQCNMALEHFK